MSDFRVDIKVRNNRLITLIEEQYGTVAQFAKACKLSQGQVGDYCNLKDSPITKKRVNDGCYDWKPTASNIAEALGVLPEEIWPEHLQQIQLNTNKSHVVVTAGQIAGFIENLSETDPLLTQIKEEQKELVHKALETLTTREAKVLNLRFGIEDGHAKTLREIGDVIGVSTERVRHIEAKALRKLRHPSRSTVMYDI